MTVATTNITSGPYTGTGTGDEFSYDFRVDDKTQLSVWETTDLGVKTLLTVDTDYTVAGVGVDGGGTITRVAGNLPTDYIWYIRSNYADTQATAFASQGGFSPAVHEAALDKRTFVSQQQQDEINRTIKLDESDESVETVDLTIPVVATRASQYLGFDASGNLITIAGTAGAVTVSTFMKTLLDDNDIGTALGTLGLSKGTDVASAGTLAVGVGAYFNVTGTTAILGIGTKFIGAIVILHFNDILIFTHHATNLILLGNANITTAAGDHAMLVEYDTGKWKCIWYSRAASVPYELVDEDDMASDSPIKVPSQQSVKAYIDPSVQAITESLRTLHTENWTEQSNPKNFILYGIVWSGSLLVAVGGADGTDAYIVTSPDGVTWTERANPKNFALTSVAWSGSLFCAVGQEDGVDAYIITSSNGTAWTEQANPKNIELDAVTWGNSLFVAVGLLDGATDAYIITSPDGITWTERANPKSKNLSGITWNGSLFVAVGQADGTDAYIVTSPDGITWTEQANPKNFGLLGVAWDGSQFCAVGGADGTDAYIVTSPDGITWTERANPKNFNLYSIIWNGSLFIAAGQADGTDAYMITSPDGITWTERSNLKNFNLRSVIFDGKTFYTVGAADGTDAYMMTSLKLDDI